MSDLRSTCAAQQGTLQELQVAAASTHAAVTAACEELAAQLQSKVSQLSGTDRQLRLKIGKAWGQHLWGCRHWPKSPQHERNPLSSLKACWTKVLRSGSRCRCPHMACHDDSQGCVRNLWPSAVPAGWRKQLAEWHAVAVCFTTADAGLQAYGLSGDSQPCHSGALSAPACRKRCC